MSLHLSPAPSPTVALAFLDILGPASRSAPPPAISPSEHFRLVPLHSRRGWPIALCEAVVRRARPDYAERRLWRTSLPEPYRSGILLFTDAAHSHCVWSWRGRTGGLDAYLEHLLPGREATLALALRAMPTFRAPVGDPADDASSVIAALCDALSALGCPSGDDRPARPSTLQGWVEEITSTATIRGAWRALRRFALLDAGARGGDRLLHAGRELEPAYLAVLERMRVFLDDLATERVRRRPEHLRDLRALVDLAEHERWGHGRDRFVRREIVQHNLFALPVSGRAARETSRDLLAYAGRPPSAPPILDCNVRDWSPAPAVDRVSGRADAPGTANGRSRGAAALREEVGVFRTAWSLVRGMRMYEPAGEDEFAAAAAQLERRRRLLRRQLLVIAASDAFVAASRIGPLPELVFSDARALAGFSMILE